MMRMLPARLYRMPHHLRVVAGVPAPSRAYFVDKSSRKCMTMVHTIAMREAAYLNTHQAADALQVTHKQISALIRAGRLPASKLGRDWAIAVDDLELVRERPKGRPRKDAGSRAPRGDAVGSAGRGHVA